MKMLLLALLCAIGLVSAGCSANGEDPSADTDLPAAQVERIAATVELSAVDFSGVKAIDIHSGITGDHLLVNDAGTIGEILAVIDGLKGDSPISSRGYYGWSYGFSLYETENPGKEDEPVFRFSLLPGQQGYIYHGLYEIVNGHTYSGLYAADGEKIAEIDAFCKKLMEDNHDKLYPHEFAGS